MRSKRSADAWSQDAGSRWMREHRSRAAILEFLAEPTDDLEA
jgi:hypothetical protein